jgi:hypothetical protein
VNVVRGRQGWNTRCVVKRAFFLATRDGGNNFVSVNDGSGGRTDECSNGGEGHQW